MNFDFIFFDEIKSTNDFAKEKKIKSPTVIMARVQSGGRGRMGRSFISEEGGLYFSAVLPTGYLSCSLSLCTAAAAVAVRRVLFEKTGKPLCIKWVNDILLDGKKVCGILSETVTENGYPESVIVGIGVNLIEPKDGFAPEIRHRAGAIGYFTDTEGAKELAFAISEELSGLVRCSDGEIISLYREHLAFVGENITAADYKSGEVHSGKIVSVSEAGELLLKTENGDVLLSSGEILY